MPARKRPRYEITGSSLVPVRNIRHYFRPMPAATRRNQGASQRGRTKKRTIRRRSKRVVRRRRVVRKKPKTSGNAIKWEYQNLATFTHDVNDTWSVVGSTQAAGKQCRYGHVGITQIGPQHTLLNIRHLGQIADELMRLYRSNSSASNDVLETKFMIKNCFQTHEIVNDSNGHTTLYAYKCMFRQDVCASFFDVSNSNTLTPNNYQSPLWILGDGFYQRGSGAVRGENNEGTRDCDLSPYDSHKFCSMIKIIKQTKHDLDAGEIIKFSIKKNKPIFINMDHYYTNPTKNATYGQMLPDYNHRKGECFYLFRIEGQPSNSNTDSTQLFYTSPNVNMITKTHYNACLMTPNLPRLINFNAIGYGTPGLQAIISDEQGTKVNEAFN